MGMPRTLKNMMLFNEGLAYLGNESKTCANCHIMRDQYDGWQKASHHARARGTASTSTPITTPHAALMASRLRFARPAPD